MTVDTLLQRNNNNLHLIRLLCAYLVIYSHAFALSPADGKQDILSEMTGNGYIALSGVAVKAFFLISGLLVTNSLLKTGSILQFISSRFFRIFPALLTVIVISALILGPSLSVLNFVDYFKSPAVWEYIYKTSGLRIQYDLPGVFGSNAMSAVNGSLWTIPREIRAYCYLLAIYIISLLFGRYKIFFIFVVALAIFLEPLTPVKGILIAKSDNPVIYELYPLFAVGCMLALFKNRIKMTMVLPLFLLAIYFVSDSERYETLFFYLFSSLFLLYLSSTKIFLAIKITRDISYGVYLWAFPVQQILAQLIPASPYINMVLAAAISSIIAYASCRLIETPAVNYGRSLSVRKTLVLS